jgi:hypothetical protein
MGYLFKNQKKIHDDGFGSAFNEWRRVSDVMKTITGKRIVQWRKAASRIISICNDQDVNLYGISFQS